MNNSAPFSPDKATLLWLSLSYCLMILPLYQDVSYFIYIGSLFVIGLRFAVKLGYVKEPNKYLVAGLAVAAAGIIVVFSTRLGFLNVMLNVLVLGCALKFLEFRAKRDLGFHILALFFLAAVSFVYHQNIAFSLYLLFVSLLTITALLSIFYIKPYRLQWRRSAELVLQSLPLMILLFIFIPRLGPLWMMPQANSAKTGMSDSMSPGDLTQLTRSSELVFRVSVLGERPIDNYWRALVFEAFDGRKWSLAEPLKNWMRQVRADGGKEQPIKPKGGGLAYKLILEPSNSHWFYALDLSLSRSPSLKLTPYHGLYSTEAITKQSQYSLTYYPQGGQAKNLSETSHRQNLRLPIVGNQRAKALARNLREQYAEPQDLASAAMNIFKQEPFYYTLEPPPLGSDSIDQFLFHSRKGFCEHYASSFAFLMRAAGIPARVVVGYLGGEYSEGNNYVSVYQFDAHAWVELWFEGLGWQRFDPTAMVAPERVSQGLDVIFEQAGFSAQDPFSLVRYRHYYFINQVRLMLADMDYRWSVWVLGYDLDKQKNLLSGWFGQGKLARLLGFISAMLVVMLLSWWLGYFIRGGQSREPLLQAYLSSCRKLSRQGIVPLTGETPLQFSQRLQEMKHPTAQAFALITQSFIQGQYMATVGNKKQRLKRLTKKIRRLKLKL